MSAVSTGEFQKEEDDKTYAEMACSSLQPSNQYLNNSHHTIYIFDQIKLFHGFKYDVMQANARLQQRYNIKQWLYTQIRLANDQ